MSFGTPGRVPGERKRRSVVAELVQDIAQQWGRASHARALANARRAATQASAAGVERAEVNAWLRTMQEDEPADPAVPDQRGALDDDADEVGAGV